MAVLKNTNKKLSAKRIQEIENYELSLFQLVNPNTKSMLQVNPIAGEIALKTLRELKAELEAIEIDMNKINCNRVYDGYYEETTETERFIKNIGDCSYIRYKNDYLKMMEQRELEEVFPVEERKARILELEAEIKREVLKGTTLGKLNNDLRKSCEARAEELRNELHSIKETFDVVDEEYLNSMLYMIADRKIKEIVERIDLKINYLTEILI